MKAGRNALLTAALLSSIAFPVAASANLSTSENWAGYAVHASGLRFQHVTGSWRQPAARCTRGHATYSAFWVGIGGFSSNSSGLEQIGTELDCNARGVEYLYPWYETLPALSQTIPRMRVAPGDQLTAAVWVAGRSVTLAITDWTQNESFAKTVAGRAPDTTSAEWIAEAPSDCGGYTIHRCPTLPLADFGSVSFNRTTAVTTTGFAGPIASPIWVPTGIFFAGIGRGQRPAGVVASAAPSGLSAHGSAFSVHG